MSGSYNSQDENNPNVPVAENQVRQGLTVIDAANRQSQAESMAFIQAYGAGVLHGHDPVNSPTKSLLQVGTEELYDAGND